jgi:hypothetical protein
VNPNETTIGRFAEHGGTRLVAVHVGDVTEHDDTEIPVSVPQFVFRQVPFAHAGYPTL